MVDVAEKVISLRLAERWTSSISRQFGAFLEDPDLDGLWSAYEGGRVDIWEVMEEDKHIASFASRIDITYNGSKSFELIHSGGEVLRILEQIDPLFTAKAREAGCVRLTIYTASRSLMEQIKKRLGFEDYEFTIARAVE